MRGAKRKMMNWKENLEAKRPKATASSSGFLDTRKKTSSKIGHTIFLVRRKYRWPTLDQDVHVYVLSYECRRRRTSVSQRVAIILAIFL